MKYRHELYSNRYLWSITRARSSNLYLILTDEIFFQIYPINVKGSAGTGYFFQVVLFLDSYQRPRGEGWKKYKQQWPIFFDKLNLGSHRRMRIVMDQSLSAVVCNHISLQCSMSMSNLTLHLPLPVGEKWKIKYWFHKLRWLWIFRLCQNLNLTFHILWR